MILQLAKLLKPCKLRNAQTFVIKVQVISALNISEISFPRKTFLYSFFLIVDNDAVSVNDNSRSGGKDGKSSSLKNEHLVLLRH